MSWNMVMSDYLPMVFQAVCMAVIFFCGYAYGRAIHRNKPAVDPDRHPYGSQ